MQELSSLISDRNARVRINSYVNSHRCTLSIVRLETKAQTKICEKLQRLEHK